MVIVGVNGTLTLNGMSLVYNVLSSGNIIIINTVDVSADVRVINCTFSVNGTSAVVPQPVINHGGGKISISQTVFENISLSSQALISYNGMKLYCYLVYVYIFIYICFCYIFVYFRCTCITEWKCRSSCSEH
jgi:hypothetical protein